MKNTELFENIRGDCHSSIAVFRLRFNARRLLPDANKLLIVANTKGRARTKVEYRFGAVGLSLTILPKEYVQTFVKDEFFPFIISEILQE